MRRPRPTLRMRLTLWFAGTLAAVLSVYAGLVWLSVSRGLSAELDRQVAEDHLTVEANLEQTKQGEIHWHDPSGAIPRTDESEAWIDVRTAEGSPIHRHVPRWAAHTITGMLPFPAGMRGIVSLALTPTLRIRAFVGQHQLGGRTVYVLAGRSEARMEAQLRTLLAVLALGLPVGVAIASLGGYALARRALAPVDAITEHARRITVDQLREQLPVDADDELGRLAATFNEAFSRIARSFDELRSFTAHASHELRTPLAALRAVGEVGLREGQDASAAREVIGSMLEEADRMARLLDSLLALTRIEGGERVLSQAPFELRKLVRATVVHISALAEERNQRITVNAVEFPIYVAGEEALIRQALVNLLDNAIKYSPHGTTIEIAVSVGGVWAMLAVTDEGLGIDPAQEKRIFERFFRGSQAGSTGASGFGLGLTIARAVVEAHQGTLEARSGSPRGSKFLIRLPRLAQQA